jgi:hypothetical protein
VFHAFVCGTAAENQNVNNTECDDDGDDNDSDNDDGDDDTSIADDESHNAQKLDDVTEDDDGCDDNTVVDDISHSVEQGKRQKHVAKKIWTDAQKSAVRSALGHYVRRLGKCPGKEECMNLIQSDKELFEGRTWQNIKDYVRNEQRKFFTVSR